MGWKCWEEFGSGEEEEPPLPLPLPPPSRLVVLVVAIGILHFSSKFYFIGREARTAQVCFGNPSLESQMR